MASRGGGNEVEIVVKTKDETKGTGQRVKRELIRQGGEAGKGFGRSFGTGVKGSLAGAATVAKVLGAGLLAAGGGAAALAAGAVVLGPKLANASARLKDLDAKAQAVFVGELPRIRRWAEANKRAFGLSARETVGMAANLADLLKPMGFTAREAGNMTTKLLDLSGALSKWSGGQRSAAEVSEIISSAMLGEREQLKELGIAISEADVQARLAAKGQDELKGAALAQAEAVATMELIYAKSTDAQKAWANGGRDAAVAQKSLNTTIAETKERLIATLGPAIQTALGWLGTALPATLSTLQGWWNQNKDAVGALARSLLNLFVPASAQAGTKSMTLAGALDQLRQKLTGALLFALRAAQGLHWLGIASQTVGVLIAAFGIGVGYLVNIMDRLSGGSGHAADSMVADFKQMRRDGLANIARLKQGISDLQREIDGLHGKTVDVRVRIRRPGGGFKTMLPGYQHGTESAPGGPAIVGERGPELVDLPRGARVTPAHRVAAGGGGVVRLVIDSGGSRLDDLLVEVLRKAIRSRGGDVQVVLGS